MPLMIIPNQIKDLDILEIGAKNVEAKMDEKLVKYDLTNPHPGYGKDPNILNEYGHTAYPKYIDLPTGERVIANSAAHEAELTGKAVEMQKPSKSAKPSKPTAGGGNPWT